LTHDRAFSLTEDMDKKLERQLLQTFRPVAFV